MLNRPILRALLRPALAAGLVVLLLPELPLGSLLGHDEGGACCGMSCCVGATSCCCPPEARLPEAPKGHRETAWDQTTRLERDCDPACGASSVAQTRPNRQALLRSASGDARPSTRRTERDFGRDFTSGSAGRPALPRGPPSSLPN